MTVQTTRRPYGAYAAITGTFVGGLAAAGGLARLLDRDPREHDASKANELDRRVA